MIFKKPIYKTGEVAALLGVTTSTIIRYCNLGLLHSRKTEFGHHRLQAEDVYSYLLSQNMVYDDTEPTKSDVIYARVSTHREAEQGYLEQQVEKVKLFAIEQNVDNLIVKTDIAPQDLSDYRKGLLSLIDMVQRGEVHRIFVLYKERLTRFGYLYLKKICDFHGVSIVIVSDEVESKSLLEKLVGDGSTV